MENKTLKWMLLLVLAIVWGSSFILMKFGLSGLTHFQLGGVRIVFAALFLLLIGFRRLPEIPLYKWKYIIITACFGTFFPVFLFSLAISKMDTSVASILNSLTPLNTLVLGMFMFGLTAARRQFIGVFVGFIGCVVLVYFGGTESEQGTNWYALLCLLASACYGININLLKKYLSDVSPLAITVGNFTVMLIPAILVLFGSGFFDVVQEPKVIQAMFYVAVLGIVGTAFANVLFFKLIQISSPVFASSVTYLIPVVAFNLGIFFNAEKVSVVQITGALIILSGVYLSARK